MELKAWYLLRAPGYNAARENPFNGIESSRRRPHRPKHRKGI